MDTLADTKRADLLLKEADKKIKGKLPTKSLKEAFPIQI